MSETEKSYKEIIKATSLFGGVQVFKILISVIKSKVIAIWLGPLGMGIIGLLTSSLNLISEFTKLGLDTTAVREISLAANNEEQTRIPFVVSSLKKIVWLTGLIGVILTIVISPLLSQLTFGNSEYTLAYIFISISVLFNHLSNGQIAILQGLRKLKYLAKASLIGNFVGLIITLPLYYFFRLDAIVPAIIIGSVISLVFSWFYSNKVKIDQFQVSLKEAFGEGRHMLKLGFMLSLRGLITLGTVYILQIFISYYGGVDEVGFYAAGFIIINSYVGLIFNAMRTDYFPKLSSVITDDVKTNEAVFQQALIALLILTPIIVVFITAAPTIIKLLYSAEFLVIVGLVSWGILGTVFQAISWSMGYVILAKGDSNLFIKTALVFNALLLIFSVVGYYLGGLEGLGISYFMYYIIHFVGINIITRKKYNLHITKELYLVFIVSSIFCAITFLSSFLNNSILKYGIMIFMILISFIFTWNELNKRIDLKAYINTIFNKKND